MEKISDNNSNVVTIIGKDICINCKTLNVKVKIDTDKFRIYGYIGKAKVVWNYQTNLYPLIEGCSNVDYRRVAKDYIIATLLQNNLTVNEVILSCRQYNKTGNTIIEVDRNNFLVASFNGWIKGFVCGEEFVWNVNKYRTAIYVQGNNFRYCNLTDRISQWVIDAGYKSVHDLIYKLKTNKLGLSEDYYNNLEIIEDANEDCDTNVKDIISKMSTEDINASKHEEEIIEEKTIDNRSVNNINEMTLENFLG